MAMSKIHQDRLDKKLFNAVTNRKEDDVVEYIKQGGNVHHKDKGASLLSVAASKGYIQIVEVLLEEGASIHDDHGKAFLKACECSEIEVLTVFTRFGNMNKYSGRHLKNMAMQASIPDERVYKLLIGYRAEAYKKRFQRVANSRINIALLEDPRFHKKYAELANRYQDLSEYFKDHFGDGEEVALFESMIKKEEPPTLTRVEINDLLKALQVVREQVFKDAAPLMIQMKRGQAAQVFEWVDQMVSLLYEDFDVAKKMRKGDTHKDMRKYMFVYLLAQRKNVSRCINYTLDLLSIDEQGEGGTYAKPV